MADYDDENLVNQNEGGDTQRLSVVLNVALLIAVVLLVVFGYKEGNFGGVDKKTLKKEYVKADVYYELEKDYRKAQQAVYKKDNEIYNLSEKIKELESKLDRGEFVENETAAQPEDTECHFEDLDSEEQSLYVMKDKQKPSAKDKEVAATFTCENHLSGSYLMPDSCKAKLKEFLSAYDKDAHFNLIGIVDKEDSAMVQGLKKADAKLLEKLQVSKNQVKQFETYAPLGLARARAKEAMYLIKSSFGKQTDVTQASYELVLDNKRGFVLQVLR